MEWLKHLKSLAKASAESNKVVLILDNHSSDINLEAIHKLQPLDVCFYKPLKTNYGIEVDKWDINYPGRPIIIYQVSSLFGAAYNRRNLEKAHKAFLCTGIYPFNPDVFSEEDFMGATVSERSINENVEYPSDAMALILPPAIQTDKKYT